MSIYHNLEQMKLVAVAKAKEHNCNYNIIMLNPDEHGTFSLSAGSTYEMVADSYFDKPRPDAILLHKTDDLIIEEHKKNRTDTTQEGWCDDISGTSGRLRHYYKDGRSLCGSWYQKHYFKHFDNSHDGSKFHMDCAICIRKLKQLKDNKVA